MKEIGLQYPPSGLACYIYWNDEKITLDEYDKICATFKTGLPFIFRARKIYKIYDLVETVTSMHEIRLTGKMEDVP